MTNATILLGDVRQRLRELPDQCVQTCITSPPYWGLRDYGETRQIGLEQTPDAYVAEMVSVFAEVRRVLRDDGTLWLNLGDSYNGSGGAGGDYGVGGFKEGQPKYPGRKVGTLKPKDLVGIPWRVAFALQADGWYLRQDIIWHKPNPMPESVTDRCTKSHEYVFLLSKSARYYFDNRAIAEPAKYAGDDRGARGDKRRGTSMNSMSGATGETRNKRDVWEVATKPFSGAHFAVMPEALVEPCIKASISEHTCSKCGTQYERQVERAEIAERRLRENRIGVIPGRDKPSRMQSVNMEVRTATTVGWSAVCECESPGDGTSLVLDPFTGSGTVAVVAMRHGCDFIGTELNADYAEIARKRIENDQPMFNTVTIK
jgi:DNA modification methylase